MKNLIIIVSCTLILFATGCKNKEQPNTFINNVTRPATWTVPESYDYISSMTAVIKVNLTVQYPIYAKDFILKDDDILAAFYNDVCLGVSSPQNGLFYLYIAAPTTNGQTQIPNITLRYYSAYYKNLFEAKDAFPFKTDAQLGSVATPYIPMWNVIK